MIGEKLLAQNKKAWHDYFIEDKYEAGVALIGTEVKSCRMSKVNLRDSYVQIKNAEAFINNMHISPYEKGNIFNHDPMRSRKLLLHKQEITKLLGLVTQKGFTLIPLRMYFKYGKIKLEIGLCKGKHQYDKRQDLKEKAVKRDIERHVR
ncbi:MAG: SsrA-binding protein SmpB [Christensenellaceae bacterium]